MNLREMERDLRTMTGSPASDAVTRATIGLELLAVLREARAALAHMCEGNEQSAIVGARAVLKKVQDV